MKYCIFFFIFILATHGFFSSGIGAAEAKKTSVKVDAEQELRLWRILLKSEGRLKGVGEVREKYGEAFRKYPKDEGLRADYLDLLIDSGEFEEAKKILIDYVEAVSHRQSAGTLGRQGRDGPHQEALVDSYELAIYLGQKRYKEALPLLEREIERHPSHSGLKRDLAYILWQRGEWPRSKEIYQEILKQDPLDIETREILCDLCREFDHRVGPRFEIYHLGSNYAVSGGVEAHGYITKSLEYWGDNQTAYYKNATANDHVVNTTEVKLDYHFWPYWTVGVGGMGAANTRNNFFSYFSPEARMQFERPDQFTFQGRSSLWRFWQDPIEAVDAGGQASEVGGNFLWHVITPLYLSGEYYYDRYRIANGTRISENEAGAGLEYVFWNSKAIHGPDFSAAYRFVFRDVNDTTRFAGIIPLIPRVESHYLEFNYTQKFRSCHQVNGTFFIGQDSKRGLDFMRAELIGVRVSGVWSFHKNWEAKVAYEYSRESLSTVSGQVNRGTVGLDYYW